MSMVSSCENERVSLERVQELQKNNETWQQYFETQMPGFFQHFRIIFGRLEHEAGQKSPEKSVNV